MRRALLTLFGVALLAGCAKSQLIPRSEGRVDGARSIASYSDEAWTIAHEPAPAETPAEPAAETPAP